MFKNNFSLLICRYSRRFIQNSANENLLNNEEQLSELLPSKIYKKRQRTPEAFYLANQKGADIIADALKPHISAESTLLEFNPGIGLMTQKFVDWKLFKKIILIEQTKLNNKRLINICQQNNQECSLKRGDFINLWKIVFQDKIDDGSRVANLLADVPKKLYADDPNMVVFGAVGSYVFFKHLINSIVFQNSLFSFGRSELYLVMPPAIYVHLTCSNEIGYMIYRSSSMLFQMMFEHKFITKLPREYFLPRQAEYKFKKSGKLDKVNSINPDGLYLVKIVPRRNFYEFCAPADVQALWYFVKQNCVSRRNRIIPNLEKYVPGCGPRLIVQSKPPTPVKLMYPNETSNFLPKYSTNCVEISNECFFPNLNIHTEFGDLTPNQMLTLFCQFRNWPEYKDSSFLASLENSLLKLEASVDGNVDVLEVPEEDDVTIVQ
ncbi:dimethyladenosine transferase 2, mitochondrial [Eupeodes corollae]|uniref:dimethyladenosine transferase 2, mitochondrial n=1 Tax=Eupeodes corollae TaxID=290404 RepID=UPI00249198EC|nr:dimethyladenosine transferase 2, mitochondrial [Eupeodes corollae]